MFDKNKEKVITQLNISLSHIVSASDKEWMDYHCGTFNGYATAARDFDLITESEYNSWKDKEAKAEDQWNAKHRPE